MEPHAKFGAFVCRVRICLLSDSTRLGLSGGASNRRTIHISHICNILLFTEVYKINNIQRISKSLLLFAVTSHNTMSDVGTRQTMADMDNKLATTTCKCPKCKATALVCQLCWVFWSYFNSLWQIWYHYL